MINGKVVDESSEVEQIEERKKWAQVRAEMELMLVKPKVPAGRGWNHAMTLLFYVFPVFPACLNASILPKM